MSLLWIEYEGKDKKKRKKGIRKKDSSWRLSEEYFK